MDVQRLHSRMRTHRGCWGESDPEEKVEASSRYQDAALQRTTPADALLEMAWVFAVLNEELPVPLINEICKVLNGFLPVEEGLSMLQSVALHRRIRASDHQDNLNEAVAEWLSDALGAPRMDLYARPPPRPERIRQKITIKEYPYEKWLSSALQALKIPHELAGVVEVHRVAIVFRKNLQVIDVLGLEDLTAPQGRILGTAELRRRQLGQLGWTVRGAHLRELYEAMRDRTLQVFVSKLLKDFVPAAAGRAAFRTPVLSLQAHSKARTRHSWRSQRMEGASLILHQRAWEANQALVDEEKSQPSSQ